MPQKKPKKEFPPRPGNQSIHNCFDILEMLISSPEPLTIKKIAMGLGMSLSAVHSILLSMVSRGYVTHLGPRRGYVLGPALNDLYRNMSSKKFLINIAQPLLKELSEACDNETCFLGYFHKFYVESLLTVLSPKLLAVGHVPNKLTNIHASSQGKLLLSHLSPKDYDLWKRETGKLQAYTSYTTTVFEVLEKELEQIRRQGYAENVQESEEGVYIVASPIFNYVGTAIGSIAVGIPVVRLNESKRKTLISNVIHYAARISEHLGYSENP